MIFRAIFSLFLVVQSPLSGWHHPGAASWDKPGLSKDPYAAINAARAACQQASGIPVSPALIPHPGLERMARVALDYPAHALGWRTDLLRDCGWPVIEQNPPGPCRPGILGRNWDEQTGSSCNGYLEEVLAADIGFCTSDPNELHAWSLRMPGWTHVGFAEREGGHGFVIWLGYLPAMPIRPSTIYRPVLPQIRYESYHNPIQPAYVWVWTQRGYMLVRVR